MPEGAPKLEGRSNIEASIVSIRNKLKDILELNAIKFPAEKGIIEARDSLLVLEREIKLLEDSIKIEK